jgi:hypothetical protein
LSTVEDTIERFVDVMAYLQSPIGLHRYDDHIFVPTPANIRKVFTEFTSIESSLDRLQEGELPWYERLRIDEMRKMIRSTKIGLEWEISDFIYPIQTIGDAAQDVLDYPFMESQERTRLLIARLKHSGFLFQACMMRNQRLSKLHIRLAVEQGRAVMKFIQDLPSQFKSNPLEKELSQVSKEATTALSQYLEYLELRAQTAPERIMPQRHQLEKMLQELWGMDVSPEDLKRVGEEQLQRWSKRLVEYGRQIDPKATDWKTVWEKIKTYNPNTEDEIVDDHRKLLEDVRQALKAADLIDLPDGEAVQTSATPEWQRMFATGGSCSSDDMYGKRVTSKLRITPRTAGVAGPIPPPSRVLLAHECYAGHHVHAINIGQHAPMPFKIRTQIRVPVSEGWAMLAEEFLEDKYTAVERMQLCMSVIRRAVRIIADVGLNTGEMTYDQAVDFYEKTVGVRATNEVNSTLMLPGYKSAYLFGKVTLERLRDEVKKELGHRFDIKWFNNLVVRAGTMSLAGISTYVRKHAEMRKRLAQT